MFCCNCLPFSKSVRVFFKLFTHRIRNWCSCAHHFVVFYIGTQPLLQCATMPIFLCDAQCCSSAYSDIIFISLACFFIKVLPVFSDNYSWLYQSRFCSHLLEKRLAEHTCWVCVFFASCSNLLFIFCLYVTNCYLSWINVQTSYSNEANKLMKKVAWLMKCHKRKSFVRQHNVINGTTNVDRTLFKFFWGDEEVDATLTQLHIVALPRRLKVSTNLRLTDVKRYVSRTLEWLYVNVVTTWNCLLDRSGSDEASK